MKSKNSQKIPIEIWGTYPPPFGGVTVHIKRLFYHLKKRKNLSVQMLNFNGNIHNPEENIFKVDFTIAPFLLLPFKKKKLIHFHSRKIIGWVLMRLFGFRHLKMVTLHNQILRKSNGKFKKKLTAFGLNGFDKILLNDKEYGMFLHEKFKVSLKKMHFIPAFISPLKSEFKRLPEEILKFRKEKQYLISANAWMLVRIEGKDLYGFDTLIRLMKLLKEKNMDVGLIFVLPQIGDVKYFNHLQNEIEKNGLKNDILIFRKGIPNAFEIWGISDLFIRPTMMDIEGISVKEALFMGTPVIASDVCQRPHDCQLYPYGNFEQLLKITKEILLRINEHKHIEFHESVVELIINEYEKLAKQI